MCTESQVWERRRWILPAEAGLVDRAIGEAEGEGYGRDRPGPYLLLLTSALTPCFIVSRQFFLEGPRDHFLLYISSVSIRCPRQHRSYPRPSRSIYQRLSRPVCFLLSLRFIMQVPLPPNGAFLPEQCFTHPPCIGSGEAPKAMASAVS